MATLDFATSVANNVAKLQQSINEKCYTIGIKLFLRTVSLTPSPTQRGAKHADGLLVNQWYPKDGPGFSTSLSSSQSDNGSGSISRIEGLRGGKQFLGKNGSITLANNVHYGFRAEMAGWPAPEWSGDVGPYRMIALALQEVAARNR